MSFNVLETTIADVHAAYRSGQLTCRQLVQSYLDRIENYDRQGPAINAIITINPARAKRSRPPRCRFQSRCIRRSLARHSDHHERPGRCGGHADHTRLGAVQRLLSRPRRLCRRKLKKAGAIILAKATLGELGGGDTHGSLFGSTKNPYDLARTAGGSSGGSGASVSANFCTVAVGQEGFASIRRPSTWNCVAGMRPTAGLVSRSGVFAGWPSVNGSLGPMARTVTDLAKLLDVMAGYDPDDPVTAHGVGRIRRKLHRVPRQARPARRAHRHTARVDGL